MEMMPLRHARGSTSTASSTAGMKYHRNSGDANDILSIPLRAAEAVRHYRSRAGNRHGSGNVPVHMTKTQLTAVINDPRIADERHVNAYRVSGLLLVLYGFVPIGWTTYAFLSRDAPLGEFLRSVVWPVKTELVLAMTPYEWAFAVSLIVVGACALARRRAARGGAAALAVGILVV